MTPPLKGVEFNAPPAPILGAMLRQIDAQIALLPADANGAVVAVATEAGINAAIVHRVGSRFQVAGFIGKRWSTPVEGGASVKFSW